MKKGKGSFFESSENDLVLLTGGRPVKKVGIDFSNLLRNGRN
jgi:hypothetical protein